MLMHFKSKFFSVKADPKHSFYWAWHSSAPACYFLRSPIRVSQISKMFHRFYTKWFSGCNSPVKRDIACYWIEEDFYTIKSTIFLNNNVVLLVEGCVKSFATPSFKNIAIMLVDSNPVLEVTRVQNTSKVLQNITKHSHFLVRHTKRITKMILILY